MVRPTDKEVPQTHGAGLPRLALGVGGKTVGQSTGSAKVSQQRCRRKEDGKIVIRVMIVSLQKNINNELQDRVETVSPRKGDLFTDLFT